MTEIMDSIEKQVLSPTNNDQFFDAEEGVLEQIKTPAEEIVDDDFLKKIDEAISDEASVKEPPEKKICMDNDVISQQNVVDAKESFDVIDEETLLKDDESKDVATLIDEKSENDLLKGLDDDIQNIDDEFQEILDSVQNKDSSQPDDEEKSKETEPKTTEADDEKGEINENLLELCGSPPKNIADEQSSNDSVSNENGVKEENEQALNKDEKEPGINLEQEKKDEETTDQTESNQNCDTSELQSNNETDKEANIEPVISISSSIGVEPEEKTDGAAIIDLDSSESEKMEIDESLEEESKTVKVPEDSSRTAEVEEVPDQTTETETVPDKVTESPDINMAEIEEVPEKTAEIDQEAEKTSESDVLPETKMDEDVNMADLEIKTEEPQTIKRAPSEESEQGEDEKKPIKIFKKENIEVKLSFMKKFAKSMGKLSRDDLEELLIEKITEAIVFRSECTELRSKCEKQDEIIDNLKQRVQSITKQYNDLDMIHKRIVKDLKERPDQPITPVKITRAVGLQVYQPHTNNSNNLKPKILPTASTNSKLNNIPVNKRPNDSDLSDTDAKRKKSNKITPMRPPLSEREKASLEKQEATIEQKIRTKVHKPDIPISPGTTKLQITNGMPHKVPSTEKLSSTQSIDLTDEDDAPSSQQPPALVAIQKSPFVNPRGLIRPNLMVRASSPSVRMDPNRPIGQRHPAPLPATPPQSNHPGMKKIPPRPTIKINNVPNGIIVSWTVDALNPEHAEIHSYQIYAYEETRSAPSTEAWKHVGDVKALLLPMAVTLTQFQEGQKYFFAVRAVDIHRRMGQFSLPKTW